MKLIKLFICLLISSNVFAQSDLTRIVCSGANANVTISSTTTEVNLPGGTTYTWTTSVSPSASVNGVSDDLSGNNTAIIQTLTNISASPAVVIYTIVPSVGNPFMATITVNPTPNVVADQIITICSGSIFNIVPSPTQNIVPAGTLYTWGLPTKTGGSAIGGGSAQSGQSIISDALTLSGTTTYTATYSVTPIANGCQGNNFNVIVSVKPAGSVPTINNVSSALDKCSGFLTGYTATSSIPATTTFTWLRPLTTGILNSANTNNNASPNENLINTTTGNVKVTYLFTLTNSAGGCASTTPVFINIKPVPAIAGSPLASSMCSNGIPFASPTFSNIPIGTTFLWGTPTQPAGISGGTAATGQSSISQVLRNTTNASINATYVVTPTFNGCNGSSFQIIVKVNPVPNITTTQSIATCSGSGFNFTPSVTGNIIPSNTTYTWAAPPSISISSGAITGGSTQTTAQTVPFGQILTNTTVTSPSPTATYTIIPTAGSCTGNTFNLVTTVNPVPSVSPLNQTVSVCSGTRFDVNPQGVPATTNYSWSLPIVNPQDNSISGVTALTGQFDFFQKLTNNTISPATATYTVVPIAGTCNGSPFTVVVTVNPTPNIAIQTATSCSGSMFNITPANAPNGTTYTWSSPIMSSNVTGGTSQTIGQNNISQTLNYVGTSYGTATYNILPTANGCTGNTFTFIDTISPLPVVPNLTGKVCSGTSFTATPNSSLINTTYTWASPTSNPSGLTTGGSGQPIAQANILGLLTNSSAAPANAIYTIIPSVVACIGQPFTLTETVNPSPGISNIKTTVCSDNAFTVTPPNTPVGTVYTWLSPFLTPPNSVSGGTAQTTPLSVISQSLYNNSAVPATVTYSVTPVAGDCVGNPFIVEVLVNSQISINAQSTSICSGNSFTVIPTNALAGTGYTWSSPLLSSGVTGGSSQLAAQTSISDVLNYVGTTTGTATYTVTPFNGGCVGRNFTVTVTINPLPSVSNLSGASCSGVGFTANPTSNLGATTYTWSLPVSNPSSVITGGTNQQVPQINISENLGNNSTSTAVASYIVTPYAGGCTGKTFTLIQKVNPTPNISNLKTIVCSGNTFAALPSNAPVATTYTWTSPVVTPASAITGSSAQATPLSIISQNLVNITATPATVSYTVTPTTGACAGNPFTVEVLVNISANLTDQATTICSGSSFDLKPTGVPNGTTYTWTTPVPSTNVGGTNAQNIAQNNISQTLTYNDVTVGKAVYTVTPNSAGCVGNSFNLTVSIKPLPLVTDLKQTNCSGVSFVALPTSNLTGTTYTWVNPIISPSSAITGGLDRTSGVVNISQTLTNITNSTATATYTVTPTTNGCSGNTFVFIETINPIPTLATQTATICSNNTFNIAPSNVPIGTTTVYIWDAPVINPVNSITGSSSQTNALTVVSQTLTNATIASAVATYNVTPSSGGCAGSPFAVVVTVNPRPIITSQVASTCSGTAFNVVPAKAPAGTNYIWDIPVVSNGIIGENSQPIAQASISQILINTNTNSSTGSANYTVTPITAGCTGNTFNVAISISSNSAVLNSTLTPMAVCSGSSFSYIPSSGTQGTAFIWVRDNNASIQNTAVTGYGNVNEVLVNNTPFPVTVAYKFSLSSNGCVNLNSQIVNVMVNPAPALSSLLTPPAICTGASFNYAATSNTFDVQFKWNRSYVVGISDSVSNGTGNVSEVLHNPTYNAVIVPYIFKLSANGCTNSQTVYLIVNPVLTVQDISIASCSGSNLSITPANAPVGTRYLWDSPVQSTGVSGGDAQNLIPQNSISQTLVNIGTNTGNASYVVTPIIPATYTTGCTGHPFNVFVSVNPIPSLNSNKTPPVVCSGTNFNYIPTSATPGSVFSWERNATNGISNSASKGNTLINEVLLDITISSVQTVYRFKVTANGCTDTTQIVLVTVNPVPLVASQPVTICSKSSFAISSNLEPLGTNFTWANPVITPSGALSGYTSQPTIPNGSFGDTLINLTNNIATATYMLQPVGGSCSLAAFNVIVTVKPSSTVKNQTTQTCSGTTFDFIPANVPTGTIYTWQQPTINPVYTITGGNAQNNAQLSIAQTLINFTSSIASAFYPVIPNTNGCIGDTILLRLDVNPIPTVSISGNSALCRNLSDTISLTFNGTSPWTYSYIDSKSNNQNIVSGIAISKAQFIQSALPNTSANYNFGILRLRDAFCSNDTSTATLTQQMYDLPFDTIYANSGTQICSGKTVALTVSPVQNSYQWYINDTLIAGANNSSYDASKVGVYSAKISNTNGCINYALNKIATTQLKDLKLQFTYSANCKDLPISFKNNTDTSFINNLKFVWLFGDGDSTQSFNTVHTYKTGGTKTLTLKAILPKCNDTYGTDSLILIEQSPDGIQLPSVSTYTNTKTLLQARSIQGYDFQYRWLPAAGLDSTNVINPNFYANHNQKYLIKMTAPSTGCVTTDTLVVRLYDGGTVNIFIPKSFTPNHDGVNDILYPYIAGIKEFHFMRIYNKFGRVVFESRNVDNGWDGTFNGNPQPLDAYVWVAEGISYNGELITKTGNVLLLR